MASPPRRKRMDLHNVLHPASTEHQLPRQMSALRLDEHERPAPGPAGADGADDPEDVRLAVSALGSLRSASWAPSSTSPPPASSSTTADSDTLSVSARAAGSAAGHLGSDPSPEVLGAHPLVRGTLDAYARAKETSKLVRYGAGLVESVGRPVISRVGGVLGESNVQQLDGFARRQLDWMYPSTSKDRPTEPLTGPDGLDLATVLDESLAPEEFKQIEKTVAEQRATTWAHLSPPEQAAQERQVWLYVLHARRPDLVHPAGGPHPPAREPNASMGRLLHPLSAVDGPAPMVSVPAGLSYADASGLRYRGSTAMINSNASYSGAEQSPHPDLAHLTPEAQAHAAQLSSRRVQPPQRSGLTGMLVEAGVTAGGLTGAIAARPESIKSLKYCLQWLQYATAHLEHHITALRDVMVQINHGELDTSALAHAPIAANLVQIKGDVVDTIRGVVDVVSKYAGAALPSAARNTVKGFLLSLPARWTSVNHAPAPTTPGQDEESQRTAAAANKVFTLAVESLDILRSVTVVFGESLDRVDLWVDRLRAVGLQRKRAHDEDHLLDGPPGPTREAIEARTSGSTSPRHHLTYAAGPSSGPATERVGRALSPGIMSDRSAATTTGSKRRRTRPNLPHAHSLSGTLYSSTSASASEYPYSPPPGRRRGPSQSHPSRHAHRQSLSSRSAAGLSDVRHSGARSPSALSSDAGSRLTPPTSSFDPRLSATARTPGLAGSGTLSEG